MPQAEDFGLPDDAVAPPIEPNEAAMQESKIVSDSSVTSPAADVPGDERTQFESAARASNAEHKALNQDEIQAPDRGRTLVLTGKS
jgi:hypothetical protein